MEAPHLNRIKQFEIPHIAYSTEFHMPISLNVGTEVDAIDLSDNYNENGEMQEVTNGAQCYY